MNFVESTLALIRSEPDGKTGLAAGEPPLPRCDRYGRDLPPEWIQTLQRGIRGLRFRCTKWIQHGMPILPHFTMNTRSPSFVLLVLVIALMGMMIPEILGLTNPHPISGLLPR